jgi:hypothetical protein
MTQVEVEVQATVKTDSTYVDHAYLVGVVEAIHVFHHEMCALNQIL